MGLELGEQLAIEIDGRDGEAETRQRNRLEAAPGAEIDGPARTPRRNAERGEKLRVARERCVPAAIHPRIDV